MLTIIGLGAADLDSLTIKAYRKIKASEQVFLRTAVHPAAQDLKAEGIDFKSFDQLYETETEFKAIYEQIATQMIDLAQTGQDVVYAVPGHPLVAESTVQKIISELEEASYEVVSAPSFLDLIFSRLEIDPIEGIKVIDGLNFKVQDLDPRVDTIVSQVYNRLVASEIKLSLMEVYADDYEVIVIRGAGLEKEKIQSVPLYKLDRLDWINHLTSVYLPADEQNPTQFDRLVEIMELLRSEEEGCPWDQNQDYTSLKKHLIEETYEVIERVDNQDYFGLEEELGDLLLQVVFYSQLAAEENKFTIRDVVAGIVTKLIRRHPHVFSDKKVSSSKEVLRNWNKIKQEEKETSSSLVDEVSEGLPSLIQAQNLQTKAAKVGFDWPDKKGVIDKVKEELAEFLAVVNNQSKEKIEAEFGDLLFTLVNLARFLDLEAESSLLTTINKFKRRFRYIETKLSEQNKELTGTSLAELDRLWEEAKENK